MSIINPLNGLLGAQTGYANDYNNPFLIDAARAQQNAYLQQMQSAHPIKLIENGALVETVPNRLADGDLLLLLL